MKKFLILLAAGLALSAPAHAGGKRPPSSFGDVGEPGAVPEPATWLMMITGFGMLGVAARVRRTSAA